MEWYEHLAFELKIYEDWSILWNCIFFINSTSWSLTRSTDGGSTRGVKILQVLECWLSLDDKLESSLMLTEIIHGDHFLKWGAFDRKFPPFISTFIFLIFLFSLFLRAALISLSFSFGNSRILHLTIKTSST